MWITWSEISIPHELSTR